MKFKRSPIICILGHVDHGKTTILDAIRGTSVAKKEAGGITQMIGASYVSKETIQESAGKVALKFNLTIPGLLFIDTPGHEAFSNLRDRGGSIADLVIVVIDINNGIQPQTIESIRILKQYKTPFVIAANKIDTIMGWKSHKTSSFNESLAQQPEHIKNALDEKLYKLMGQLSEHGFDSDRYDRITEFTRQIALIPVSGKTKEGLGELLVMIAGLSQKFLGDNLEIEGTGRGKGSIIEVKEEKGLGTTVDIILYDGVMKKNDEIAYMTLNGVQKTKVRGLLLPGEGGKYNSIDSAVAAAGVKIYAQGLDSAIPGSPLEVVHDFETESKVIEDQFKSIIFHKNDELGVILRADSLGSVEALVKLLETNEIKVRDASVGQITRKEVIAASVVGKENPFLGAVLGFNVRLVDEAVEEAKNSGVPIIQSDIIYRLVDNYKAWQVELKEKMKKDSMEKLPWPAKIKILKGFIFRASKPAVFGVEILGGKIRKNYRLMDKSGEVIGEVREMQHEKEKIEEATSGQQIALSADGVIIGKNANENDVIYTYMTGDEIKKWDEQLNLLNDSEKGVYEEIRKLLRKYF
ncbi:translation initiation factor IF-2 [Candidatus Micrarchaeota archaeon]|nr:translation initiation factor IF-2 [Candidatus Micrarchaeota archaeon]